MNDILARCIDETSPQFNPNVVEGTAKTILKTVPDFLDDIFRCSLESLNKKVNLKYLGYRRLSPKEEFNKMMAGENKTIYDLARSDFYMMEFNFSYNGEPIRKQIYLPYADLGNLIKISDTTYTIVPVLSDTVISPSYKEIFVRLLKDKLTITGSTRNFVVNGERVPGEVIHSNIVKVNKAQIVDHIGKPLTSMSLYFLGEYGFRETMKRYFNTTDYVITCEDVTALRDTYNVFESTKAKPKSLKLEGYVGHDLKICVSKNVEITPLLENFIYGVIYTLDVLPTYAQEAARVSSSYTHISSTKYKIQADTIISNKYGPDWDKSESYRKEHATYIENGLIADMDRCKENDIFFWRLILGRVTFKNSYSVDRMVGDINDHFDVLQGYLDNLIRKKLKENGIIVSNFFDLLAVIMMQYKSLLVNSKEYNSDISNRYLDILYYLLYEIIVGFNKVILNLNKRAEKKTTGPIMLREVNKIFLNELSLRKIFFLVKSNAMNICMMLADYTSDIKYPKITALLEDQLVFCDRNVA